VTSLGPADALASVIRHQIESAPARRIFVEYSGGCDSSLVLASAAAECDKAGVEPPIPISLRFPALPETDEREYQEWLVQHLGLDDWVRIDVDAEMDFVGPLAAPWLRRFGAIFPSPLFSRAIVYEQARGGVLFNGEGGDEVLGPRRLAPLFVTSAALRRGKLPGRQELRSLRDLVARPSTTARRRAQGLLDLPWLRESARGQLRARLLDELRPEPTRPERALPLHLQRRMIVAILAGIHWFGEQHDAVSQAPLLDPEFVASMSRLPWRDLRDRTTVLERHFAGVLPAGIRRRRSKAVFTRAFFSKHTRAFAESWDGSGVDPELVDVDELRRQWLSPEPHGATMVLLQQAWVASTL
jgi:asparagine synthetase B (glutamine-hydrolysing)